MGCESVPGSHSNVTSSAWSQLMLARRRSTRLVSCLALKNEGVPPPKYTKRNGRPPMIGRRLTNSISRDRAATYVSTSLAFLSV